jgi:lipoprotein NlpI
MKLFLLGALTALLAIHTGHTAEPASWPEWRAPMIAKFASDLKRLDDDIAQRPGSWQLYSFRGDCRLFLGEFAGAVADFEKMIAIDPEQDAPHWRLGIAYYFNGQFEKSARQFEKYHAYDGRDRENGIWQFLAQAKVTSLEKARAGMLVYAQFDREPFPSLYEMFAGKKTPDEVLAEIEHKGLAGDTEVAFFGSYYTGLAEEQLGHRQRALELLEKAVALPQARAPGGPGYMWQVARLHWERLRATAAQK